MSSEYIWYTDLSHKFLEKDYLLPGQTLDERITIIANAAGDILKDKAFAEKFKSYMKKGWISLSTPIWTNFGTNRGLPISCFGSYIEDSLDSILSTQAEVGMMTKYGGGTSAWFGALRGRGVPITDNGLSSGTVHFMQLFDMTMDVISQGNTRRGSCVGYLSIDHPDIEEFLTIKTEGSPIQKLFTGVTVSDQFMKEMIAGDPDKRRIWAKVIESRANIGLPYIIFIDNANNFAPQVFKDKNLKIIASNLCSEIMLPSTPDESFVCDLASMNILHYDEWKHTDAVQVLTYLLDAVMTEFIKKAKKIPHLKRAANFAERHRALGVGWLGYHSYLQKNMIPFESMEAKFKNTEIAKFIQSETLKASIDLASKFGEPEYLRGLGTRNTTLCAIAPTKSSAFILGQVSEGIEPHKSNYYIKDLAKGKYSIKNVHLEALLIEKEQNKDEVWDSILLKRGSVQHLNFLSDLEKQVFKTFAEISAKEVIIQASARQKFIDQGQSLNIMIHPETPIKDVNALYILAWELGIKSLYYQYSINAAAELNRNLLDCISCSS